MKNIYRRPYLSDLAALRRRRRLRRPDVVAGGGWKFDFSKQNKFGTIQNMSNDQTMEMANVKIKQ